MVTNKSVDSMLLSFPRTIGLRRHTVWSLDSYKKYVKTFNGRSACYTSLYSYERFEDSGWDGFGIEYKQLDVDSVVIDRAWWDFDTTETHGIDKVKQDVALLCLKLSGDVRIVATGRGFHVHQLFSKPIKGVKGSRDLERYQRQMSKGLDTLDGVGHASKLTRIPDTFNPKRGRWAVTIDPEAFRADPMNYSIPKRPDHTLKKYDPFMGMPNQSTFDITQWLIDNPEDTVDVGTIDSSAITIGSALDIPLPNCLERAIHKENPRHEIRVALAQFLSQNLRWFADKKTLSREQMKDIENQICGYIATLNWRDYREATTKQNVRYIINTYNNSPSPKWYKSKGYCSGEGCWFCAGN